MSKPKHDLKTLIVLDYLELGGATRINQEMTTHLDKSKLILLSGKSKDYYHLIKEFGNLKRYSFVPNFKNRTTYYFSVFFNTLFKTFSIIKKYRLKKVILNLPYSSLAIIFNPFYRKVFKTYIFHGAWDLELFSLTNQKVQSLTKPVYKEINNIIRRSKFFIHYHVQKTCLQQSNEILAFSKYSHTILTKYFHIKSSKIKLVTPPLNSVILASKLTNAEKNLLRKKYVNKNETLFLIPSRLEPRKGIKIALEATHLLEKLTTKKFKILFTGPIGPDEYYILELFKYCQKHNLFKNNYFINSVTRSNLYNLYQICDCVIMPSIDLETFGLITIEALSFNVPVLGFNLGATAEILSNFDKRLLINIVDSTSLTQKMKWFLELSHRKKNALKNKIHREFDKFIPQYNQEFH